MKNDYAERLLSAHQDLFDLMANHHTKLTVMGEMGDVYASLEVRDAPHSTSWHEVHGEESAADAVIAVMEKYAKGSK